MSLVVTRQVTESITNTETGESEDFSFSKQFEIMLEGSSLHFVRGGAVGTKIADLTKEQIATYKKLESPK